MTREPSPQKFVPAVLPGALSALSAIGLMATSGWLICRASERPPVLSLCVAIGAVQAFSLGRGLWRYMQRLGVHRLSLQLLGKLRLRLFDLLEPRVPGSVTGSGTSSALSGFVSDSEAIAEGFAKGLAAAADVIFSILFGTLLAALVEPRLGLVVLTAALAVVAVAWLLSRFSAASESAAATERANLANLVTETVSSARELVAYGREDIVSSKLEEARRHSASLAARSALASGAAKTGAIATAGAGLIALLGAGLAARSHGNLTGPVLAAVAFATLAALDQCAALPATLSATVAASSARRRLRGLSELPTVPEPLIDGVEPSTPGEAALEHATVTAPSGATVLKGVTLTLQAGQRVALTGPSGAGKTSAVHALLHFVGCSAGCASLGGADVTGLSRPGIARLASWLPDESHLFAASLRDNLRIACPRASDEQLSEALRKAGLTDWFASLPEGFATRLGAGGRPVSGGERQRTGMARALLSGAPVLLLDEPTARLDAATSAEVLPQLLGAAQDRSVLVVTHEPEVVGLVDEVVVLAGGEVVRRAAANR